LNFLGGDVLSGWGSRDLGMTSSGPGKNTRSNYFVLSFKIN